MTAPLTPPLRTERLWLDPLDPDRDAADLHPMFADPKVMRFWDTPPHQDPAATTRIVRELLRDSHAWSVRTAAGGPAVGMVAILGGTAVPGVEWILRREQWGHGYASEAASAMVVHALGELGMERVEAWVHTGNARSLAVARRAGLTDRGWLPQRYPHQALPQCSVVLGRSARPEPTAVLTMSVQLPVVDVAATSAVLVAVLGMSVIHSDGEPLEYRLLGAGPWSGAPRVGLVAADPGDVERVELTFDTATELDAIHARAVAAGLEVDGPPTERPWGRREFTWTLADGHALTVSGPL